MTRKSGDRPLEELERWFQALRDRTAACPGPPGRSWRPLSRRFPGHRALRAAREDGLTPAAAPPGDPASPPSQCETDLRHVFNAIPDMLTVIDRDFNIVLSNWYEPTSMVPAAARRGRTKCYRVYHRRDRPCEDCHVRKVFATGQPQKAEKINAFSGRALEFSAFPILSESGQAILAAEHAGHHRTPPGGEGHPENEARFRTLIEDSPESLFLTDVQGTILAASRVAARRLGKNLEEVVGASLFELLPGRWPSDAGRSWSRPSSRAAPSALKTPGTTFILNITSTPSWMQMGGCPGCLFWR